MKVICPCRAVELDITLAEGLEKLADVTAVFARGGVQLRYRRQLTA